MAFRPSACRLHAHSSKTVTRNQRIRNRRRPIAGLISSNGRLQTLDRRARLRFKRSWINRSKQIQDDERGQSGRPKTSAQHYLRKQANQSPAFTSALHEDGSVVIHDASLLIVASCNFQVGDELRLGCDIRFCCGFKFGIH